MEKHISRRHWVGIFAAFLAAFISCAANGESSPKDAPVAATSVLSNFQIGFLRLGLDEQEFKSIFKNIDSHPIGSSGECAIYDLSRSDMKRLYPWLDARIVELVFSPRSKGNGAFLTQISVLLDSPKTALGLIDTYHALLGASKAVNKNMEEWDLGNDTMLDVSTYGDASAFTISLSTGICIDYPKK